MGFVSKLIGVIVVIGILGSIVYGAYYFDLFGLQSYIPISGIPGITAPNSQFINGSLGNNVNANYSSQYRLALNITKKYNEPIKKIILFSGNLTNSLINANNEQQFSTQGTSLYQVKYNGFYIPISQNISDELVNDLNYIPSLVGKTVYLEFTVGGFNKKVFNITQAPYTVKSERIVGPKVFWYLTQATGIPDSTAINWIHANETVMNKSVFGIVGIYYNGTEILTPTG
ncbi:MAG: hypothetical protein LVQ97_00495 [Candidatus Micrarchaeales archaeon]|jgi:hypothetical protein|nr:hypothetical protein [Candidatus Micrarchaeales archaeon]